MFKSLLDWYMSKLETGGYKLIVLLMAMESSIIPLPSEAVIPPAAHLAYSKPSSGLTILGIIVAGTIGSWIGAAVMYWASRLAGRPLVIKYGKLVLISPAKIEGAERWAQHYGAVGIFISRLLPLVRHLIGIPAGIVRMNFWLYSLYTVLGSGIWCAVLSWSGIRMGQDKAFMEGKFHRISLYLAVAMLGLGALYYFFVHRHMKKHPEKD